MKITKRLLAVLLALVLLCVGVPFAAVAEDGPTEWIEIYTYEDLDDVRYDLTANYKLMNDIDMTEWVKPGGDYDYFGQGWNPIGGRNIYANDAFSGIFDGNGHLIKGLRMDVTSFPSGSDRSVYYGLFACVSGTVRNLAVMGNITIKPSIYRNNYAGGIAACLESTGVIENCTSYVNISARNPFSSYNTSASGFGGIVGLGNGGKIYKCVNSGRIESHNGCGSGYDYVSGIASFNIGELKDCYNTGEITSNLQNNAGILYGSGSVTKCYNIGTVAAGNRNFAISSSTTSATDCFYLRDSGTSSTGAAERTDAQMRRQITFDEWDFDNIWTMDGRDDYFYPELRNVPLLLPDDFKTPISGTLIIDGAQEAGSILTVSVDNLMPEDATVSYSWKLDDTVVSMTDYYQIQAEDIGKTLTLSVVGTGNYKGTLTVTFVIGAPHVHTEGEVVVENEVAATCSEMGSYDEVVYCGTCGEVMSRELKTTPSLGHDWHKAPFVPATCITGSFAPFICFRCGEILKTDLTDPLGHNPRPVYTWSDDDSTVTATMVCTRCDKTGMTETAEVKTEVTVKPTCSTEGELTLIAAFNNKSFYGQTKTKTLPRDPDAHVFKVTVTPPSCIDDGYTTHACTLCRYGYSDEIVPANGHTPVTDEAVPATCEQPGLTEGAHCGVCGEVLTAQEETPLADHADADNDGLCDTCEQQMTGGDHCKYCGKVHDGAFGWLISFFHSILAIFKR